MSDELDFLKMTTKEKQALVEKRSNEVNDLANLIGDVLDGKNLFDGVMALLAVTKTIEVEHPGICLEATEMLMMLGVAETLKGHLEKLDKKTKKKKNDSH